jgi:hypothetical protein
VLQYLSSFPLTAPFIPIPLEKADIMVWLQTSREVSHALIIKYCKCAEYLFVIQIWSCISGIYNNTSNGRGRLLYWASPLTSDRGRIKFSGGLSSYCFFISTYSSFVFFFILSSPPILPLNSSMELSDPLDPSLPLTTHHNKESIECYMVTGAPAVHGGVLCNHVGEAHP